MDFTLRPWKPGDLDSLVQYADNFQIAKNLTNQFPHPYRREHGEAFLHMAVQDTPPRILAIDIGGRASGGVGIHPQSDIYCKNAELGYWLAEPFWGQGIMTRVVQEMVGYGFRHWDIDRVFARPFGTNIASQRVLEKAGFVLEARLERTLFKNGSYLDEYIYAVRRAGWPKSSA
ncbi:MAG: GNAT family N-acetyltransferase [Bacteroidia bacterium]